ncbi:MAG: hypothetical protein AB8B53_00695 [Flavobacteriales bacterium]
MRDLNRVLLFLSLLFFLCDTLNAQRSYEVQLPTRSLDVEDCFFYIDEISDLRADISRIGVVRKGSLNTPADGVFNGPLKASLKGAFRTALPFETDFVPLTMLITKFDIKETNDSGMELCIFEFEAEFLHNGLSVLSYSDKSYITTSDALVMHGENIYKGFEKCFQELGGVLFQKGIYRDLPFKYRKGSTQNETTQPTAKEKNNSEDYVQETTEELPKEYDVKNRNLSTLGYQIGGTTLVGYNYEVRVSDVFGLHLGAGISGFTGGLKLHTGPEKKSSYFNLSYKDGGFGLLKGGAIEYGGTLFKLNKKTDLGLHVQVGVLGIIDIDSELEDALFKGENAPDAILSVGVGLSW